MSKLLRCFACLVTAAAITGASRFASAEEPERRWYGWESLIVLAASDASIGLGIGIGAASKSDAGAGAPFLLAGVTAHFVGPPLVHLAHDDRVGLSWGLQCGLPFLVALPAGGAAFVYAPKTCHGDCNSPTNITYGLEVGLIAAAGTLVAVNIVDVAALSTPPRRRRRDSSSWFVTPVVSRGRSGLTVGASF